MSIRIQYAYLKQQCWLYRRNYPKELQGVLGQAFKQSLKTGDARVAKARAAEVNAKYEEIVAKAREGVSVEKPEPVRVAAPVFAPVLVIGRQAVRRLAQDYLNRRSNELQPGGFKSVRFSIGLFVSAFGDRQVGQVTRDDAANFVRRLGELSKDVGKSYRAKGLGLEELVKLSGHAKILPQTQRRIVTQVGHFLDWVVYQGELAANPFSTVRVEGKAKVHSYVAPTDEEVGRLLRLADARIADVMALCLLSGMRSGEAVGLVRDDLVWKGNLGWFAWVRPNVVRALKTDAAERFIPLHSSLAEMLAQRSKTGRLFPELDVSVVTKRFARMKVEAGVDRPGLVFHSTRKWFVTQCERAGVPEHWTASIVGHQSARSENRMTYGIYSAGISDEQKRAIVEKVGLPGGCVWHP
jgi:integrase